MEYYDLRRKLLTKEHEQKMADMALKMEWKKEEHLKRMKLLEDQQGTNQWYYHPQTTLPTSSVHLHTSDLFESKLFRAASFLRLHVCVLSARVTLKLSNRVQNGFN